MVGDYWLFCWCTHLLLTRFDFPFLTQQLQTNLSLCAEVCYFCLMKNKISLYIVSLCFLLPKFQNAQEKTISTAALWTTLLNKVQIGQHFFLSNELHLRRAEWGLSPQQFLVRPAINYKITNYLCATAGYTFIQNDPYGEHPMLIPNDEHNIWEEFTLSHQHKAFSFSHRYRLEHRFIQNTITDDQGNPITSGYRFTQRFRYRLTSSFTLKTFEKQNSIFLKLFDELWVNIDDGSLLTTGFNQNWFYFGVGYAFNKNCSLEIGYMNQQARVNTDLSEQNHLIQTTFSYNFTIKSKPKAIKST